MNSKCAFVLLKVVCLAAVLAASIARAELQIEISEGVEQAVPIAVVPFGWEGAGPPPGDVTAIISGDLARTGRFAPIAEKDMLQRPTRGIDVDFEDWRILGVEVVIVGRLVAGAQGFDIQFQVFDTFRGEMLLAYRLPTTQRALRISSHRVADMIYEKLTGIKGIFATRIAYVSVTGTATARTYRLVVADADGENPRVMLESAESVMSPVWSPDGRRIAYVSFENGNSEIFVQELRSGVRQRISGRAGVNSAPAWSPDGRFLALVLSREAGNLDVYTLDVANQVLTRLTRNPAIDTEPAWSADGDAIYFTSDRSGGPQIYKVGASGGRAERTTFEGSYNARARVSPDGEERIAVVHLDRGNYRIAMVDLERSVTQVLTRGRLDESPSFAPNGETLIYATRAGSKGVLAMVSADGRIQSRITSLDGDVREPAWSPFLGQ
jgi:TolB protein